MSFKRTNGSRYYAKGSNLTRLLEKAYNDALGEFDVLIMPTMLHTAKALPTAKEVTGVKGKPCVLLERFNLQFSLYY